MNSSNQTRKVSIAMIPSPEASTKEEKLPVNRYGRCTAGFRPATSPAGRPLRRGRGATSPAAAASPSRRHRDRHDTHYRSFSRFVGRRSRRGGVRCPQPISSSGTERSTPSMPSVRWAESLAIRGDRIVFVGADQDVAGFIGPRDPGGGPGRTLRPSRPSRSAYPSGRGWRRAHPLRPEQQPRPRRGAHRVCATASRSSATAPGCSVAAGI